MQWMKIKQWVKTTLLKTIKTMAQTAIGVIGSSALITDINWQIVSSSVAVAGIVCILMNIANLEEQEE